MVVINSKGQWIGQLNYLGSTFWRKVIPTSNIRYIKLNTWIKLNKWKSLHQWVHTLYILIEKAERAFRLALLLFS